MGLFDHFPYTNFHELNLDWMLNALRELEHTINDFVSINALKYANPIQWNITTQYEKNTIVIEPNSGTAYISVQPVPAGVSLSNTDYWTVVFDLTAFIIQASQNLTTHYETAPTNVATFSTAANGWLVWNDILYKALTNINIGDPYIEGSNIQRMTVEDAVNNVVTVFNTIIGDLNDLNTTDKSSIVNAINDVLVSMAAVTGDLATLYTTDKSSLVNAINELYTDINDVEAELKYRIQCIPKTLKCDMIIDHFRYKSNPGSILQGACYVGNNTIAAYYHTFANSNTGILALYNMSTERMSASYAIEGYHGNTVTYNPNNNRLYICGALDETDDSPINKIIVINMANPSAIESVLTLPDTNIVCGLCYNTENNVFYATHDTGNTPNQSEVIGIYNSTLTERIGAITLEHHVGVEHGWHTQGVVYAGQGLLYSLCFEPGHLGIYANKISDGSLAFMCNLPKYINYCREIAEPENMIYDYDNDEFYIGSYNYNSTAYDFQLGMISKINLYHDIDEQLPMLGNVISLQEVNRCIVDCYVANGDTQVTPAWHLSNDTFRTYQDVVNLALYYGVAAIIRLTSTRDGMTRQTRGVIELKLKNFNGSIVGQNATTHVALEDIINTPSCNVQFTHCTFEGWFNNSTDSMQVLVAGNSRMYFDRCTFEDYTPEAGQTPYHIQAIDNADVAIRSCTFNGTMTDCYVGQMAQKRQS